MATGGPTTTPALSWDGRSLRLLDQTLLPGAERWIACTGAADTAAAIARLAVRGAPNIGIAAAYGLALEIARAPADDDVRAAARVLRDARPTAVNLAWAVDRVQAAALAVAPGERGAVARREAETIHAGEDAASAAIALLGADLLAGSRRILTHCNTGALACGGTGSALAVAIELAQRDDITVLACETRPLLQGARLTIWELRRAGIDHELLVDGAAAGLIRRGEIDAVIVGCDRVAANGDVANKVGTYGLAVLARHHGIPFYVAAPMSTVDVNCACGRDIPIERRSGDEVTSIEGHRIAPAGVEAENRAFDVTPADLVTAIVTDEGVFRAPYAFGSIT